MTDLSVFGQSIWELLDKIGVDQVAKAIKFAFVSCMCSVTSEILLLISCLGIGIPPTCDQKKTRL